MLYVLGQGLVRFRRLMLVKLPRSIYEVDVRVSVSVTSEGMHKNYGRTLSGRSTIIVKQTWWANFLQALEMHFYVSETVASRPSCPLAADD